MFLFKIYFIYFNVFSLFNEKTFLLNECEAFRHNLCIIIINICTMCIIYVIRHYFQRIFFLIYCILALKKKNKNKKKE